jgi:hypothetical protein
MRLTIEQKKLKVELVINRKREYKYIMPFLNTCEKVFK